MIVLSENENSCIRLKQTDDKRLYVEKEIVINNHNFESYRNEKRALKTLNRANPDIATILYNSPDLDSLIDLSSSISSEDAMIDISSSNSAQVTFLMEYANGGDLFDYYVRHFGKVPYSTSWHIFRQVVAAVYQCHQIGIIHRDIKLENIYIYFDDTEMDGIDLNQIDPKYISHFSDKMSDDDNDSTIFILPQYAHRHFDPKQDRVKLGDFGLSYQFNPKSIQVDNLKMVNRCGTLWYIAPEVITQDSYTSKVDIYSLGAVFYTMIFEDVPFYASNYHVYLDLVKFGPNFPTWADRSIPQLVYIIRRMLDPNPDSRISIQELNDYFQNVVPTFHD